MQPLANSRLERRDRDSESYQGDIFNILIEVYLTYIQTLADWIRNNWRPISSEAESRTCINVSVIDVLWQTRRAAVEAEIREMLDITDVDIADRRCFTARTAASKRVLDRMNERERAELEAEVETRKTEGNPESVQRE